MRTPIIPKILQKYVKSGINVGGLGVDFQRTCRVPEGRLNSLPAGLGSFPVFKVSDFKSGAPKEWREDGYFFPMYRQEAMWVNFARGYHQNPKALIIGAGNINAISGKPFNPSKDKMQLTEEQKKNITDALEIKLEKEQNYLVCPPQPWIDGWKAEDGKVYQFVAAEMGSGETVEGQITGEEKIGGVQFIVYDPKKNLIPESRPHEYISAGGYGGMIGSIDSVELCCLDSCDESPQIKSCFSAQSRGLTRGSPRRRVTAAVRRVTAMGLGRGGEIDQKIYPDPHGLEVWKEKPTAVEVFYMISSEDFKQVTGHEAPPTPVTYETYQQHGYPWFELHDEKLEDSKGSDIFAKLKPVGEGKAGESIEVKVDSSDPLSKLK